MTGTPPVDPFAEVLAREALGDFEGAVAACTAALTQSAAPADVLIRRAGLKRELGRLAEAEADLVQGADLEPGLPWAQLRHAHMLEGLGRPLAALALRRAAVLRSPHPEPQVFLASSYLALHWYDAAAEVSRTLPPDIVGWWVGVRDRSAIGLSERRAAARALLRGRRGAADLVALAFALADALLRIGRLRAAGRLTEALIGDYPGDYRGFDLKRRLIEREDGPAAAAAYLKGPAARHAAHPAYVRALGLLLHDLGRFTEALAVLGDPAPEDLEDVRNARAVALLMLDRPDRLRGLCRAWLAVSPGSTVPAGYVTAAALARPCDLRAEPGAPAAVLGQFWDSPQIPDDVAAVMESWTQLNPDIPRLVFHEETARDFMREAFGAEPVAAFDLCSHPAMKADLFRIAFLLARGGVWADADERCIRPIAPLAAIAMRKALLAPLAGETPGYVHNFFMGARAGSPLLQRALDEACAAVRGLAAAGARPDIWQVTGPGLITRTAARSLLNDGEAGREDLALIGLRHYAAFAQTEVNLRYKGVAATNWHAQ